MEVAGYDSDVERISTETYAARAGKRVAPRPPNSTLDIEHARELGVPLVDWRTSVITYVKGML
jgi:dTDP-4-dehydrorhamnose reductase